MRRGDRETRAWARIPRGAAADLIRRRGGKEIESHVEINEERGLKGPRHGDRMIKTPALISPSEVRQAKTKTKTLVWTKEKLRPLLSFCSPNNGEGCLLKRVLRSIDGKFAI